MEYTNVGLGMAPHRRNCRCSECELDRSEAELSTIKAEHEALVEAAERVLADYKASRSDEMFTGMAGSTALKYSIIKLRAALAAKGREAKQ